MVTFRYEISRNDELSLSLEGLPLNRDEIEAIGAQTMMRTLDRVLRTRIAVLEAALKALQDPLREDETCETVARGG